MVLRIHFWVRVLNMRKKQHSLTDIFVTIQENQNKIVNTDFSQILSYRDVQDQEKQWFYCIDFRHVKYKQRYFDFSQNALILTPNEQFSLAY